MALRALVSLPGLTGPGPTQRRPASALCNARPVGRSTSLFRRISNWPITRHNGPSPCSAKATAPVHKSAHDCRLDLVGTGGRLLGSRPRLVKRKGIWNDAEWTMPPPFVSPATESEGNSGTGSSTGLYRGGLDPSLEQAVPRDQRPANELQAIKEASLYNWALKGNTGYIVRLLALYSLTFGLIGGPISYQTFDPAVQPLEFFLSGSTGSLLVVSVAVLRMYLGWSYVGNRLLSASVAYEETGWYDGQVFVKPQEVLARDRLLGTYEAKPALAKLKTSLTVCAVALLSCAGTLTICINNGTDADGVYGRGAAQPRKVTANGIIYSSQVRSVDQLLYDDDAAAAEAAAAGNRPAYCGDRYFKSLAGGEKVCAKFEK